MQAHHQSLHLSALYCSIHSAHININISTQQPQQQQQQQQRSVASSIGAVPYFQLKIIHITLLSLCLLALPA